MALDESEGSEFASLMARRSKLQRDRQWGFQRVQRGSA
jgi:hypothetical protein